MKLSLLIIAAFAALTTAVNIHGYPAYRCRGQRWSCNNIRSGVCCRFRVNIRSVFWSLPARAGGIAYPGLTCNGGSYPIIRGPTNVCANYVTAGRPVRSAKWIAGLFPRHVARMEGQLETREEGVDASVFTFTHNGETTSVNVPEDSVEKVAELAEKEDYEGLKALSKDWPTAAAEDVGASLESAENLDFTFVES